MADTLDDFVQELQEQVFEETKEDYNKSW